MWSSPVTDVSLRLWTLTRSHPASPSFRKHRVYRAGFNSAERHRWRRWLFLSIRASCLSCPGELNQPSTQIFNALRFYNHIPATGHKLCPSDKTHAGCWRRNCLYNGSKQDQLSGSRSHRDAGFRERANVMAWWCLCWFSILQMVFATESLRDNAVQIWLHGWVKGIRRADTRETGAEKQDGWLPGEKVEVGRPDDKDWGEGGGWRGHLCRPICCCGAAV